MTSSRVRPPVVGRVRPGLLAPVVVALVLGILGMHGIDAHGVNLHGSMTHAAHTATSTVTVVAHHEPAVVSRNDAQTGGEAAPSPPIRSDAHASGASGMGGMVMLCVAMIAGAAAALLALLVRRGRLPRWWAVLDAAARRRTVVPVVLRVGTGPPAVWRFSVIRC